MRFLASTHPQLCIRKNDIAKYVKQKCASTKSHYISPFFSHINNSIYRQHLLLLQHFHFILPSAYWKQFLKKILKNPTDFQCKY